MERCDECGFDPETINAANASLAVVDVGRKWTAPLTRFLPGEAGDDLLRARPEPAIWSAIEYAAHVRDVLALFDRRVTQILTTDRPELEVIDHEALVEDGKYNLLDAADVLASVQANADALGATLHDVPESEWSRAGTRAGEPRTALDIARRAVHESRHHLLDAGRALRVARGRS